MIGFLSGKIILEKNNYLILSVNNVGYKIYTTSKIVDGKCDFFIHEHIREGCNDLYGFATIEEMELFEQLISVSGVGPKVGIVIMTSANKEQIIEAIVSENVNFFQAVPGIGKKVAAKIIIELKSKISGLFSSDIVGKINESDEIVEALTSLGYKKHEITKKLRTIPVKIKKIEDKIRWLLQNSVK